MDVRISPVEDLSLNMSPTLSVRSSVPPQASCNSLIRRFLFEIHQLVDFQSLINILVINLPSAHVDSFVPCRNVLHQLLKGVVGRFRLCPWPDIILTRLRPGRNVRRMDFPWQDLDLKTDPTHS